MSRKICQLISIPEESQVRFAHLRAPGFFFFVLISVQSGPLDQGSLVGCQVTFRGHGEKVEADKRRAERAWAPVLSSPISSTPQRKRRRKAPPSRLNVSIAKCDQHPLGV